MKIAIATDAWQPQVNGVVRSLSTTIDRLRRRGHDVLVVEPGMFRTIPCPTYPEIRLAIGSGRCVASLLDRVQPDRVHISTEGPIGWATRGWCLKRGHPFTTAFHTRFPDYVSIRTGIRGLRRPDVMVECAPLMPDTYEAREPRLVVEVASPSTTSIDQTRKIEEYKRHPTLTAILLVETLKPQALLYRRGADGWEIETFEGLEAVIALPDIGATLAMTDIYDGLTFPARRDLASEG